MKSKDQKNKKSFGHKSKGNLFWVLPIILLLSGCQKEKVAQEDTVQGITFATHKNEMINRNELKESYDTLVTVIAEQTPQWDIPYANAYYAFLKEYIKGNSSVGCGCAKFYLAFIDEDDIPELLLVENYCHAAGVKVYTCSNDEVVEIGEFGSAGNMLYVEKEGLILSCFIGQGESIASYYKMENKEAVLLCQLHSYPDPVDWLTDLYEIDGVSVSKKEFKAKWRELRGEYEFSLVGYDDGISLNEANLETSLQKLISGQTDFSEDTGDVLNIYCWNEEFRTLMENYYPDYTGVSDEEGLIGDVKVNWIMIPTFDDEYEDALDAALSKGEKDADDRVDIFLVEPQYNAMKYIDADDICISMEELGLTDYMGDQYQFNLDAATDSNGEVKATTWLAAPEVYVYRRSVAREVFGTDDPEEIQKYLSDWETFNQSAERLEATGWKILSSYEENYRLFAQNADTPWVIDGKINIDSSIYEWVEQTKLLEEKGCNEGALMWSEEWMEGMTQSGDVFGYFAPPWLIEYVMPLAAEDLWGDWAICEGPATGFWGGTLICAAEETDNRELVKDIMYQLTCNPDIMKEMVENEPQTFVNNQSVMEELAASGEITSEFLNDQNALEVYCANAKKATLENCTIYDYELDSMFQDAFRDYYLGYCTKDEAVKRFYMMAEAYFTELSH